MRQHETIRISVQRLGTGDFLLANNLLVERKTVLDFMSSIIDGRIFRQASAMSSSGFRPIIIIEGAQKDFESRKVHPHAIQGAILSLAAVFGIPVLHSANQVETVRALLSCLHMDVKASQKSPVRKGKKRGRKRKLQLHILQGLPGVGVLRATKLIDAFGSVKAVITASELDLVAIPGIGSTIAREINRAVNSDE